MFYYLPEYKDNPTICGQKRSAEDAGLDEEILANSKKSRIDDANINNDAENFNEIIPEEIKSLIFENLSFKDLMTGSLVCKGWKTIIAENLKLTSKMVHKYQENPAAEEKQVDEGSSQFTRKYVNFKFKKLPSEINFEKKFGITRQCVKSIAIHVNVDFSLVKEFLDSFPNLTSLELVQDAEASIIFPPNQLQHKLNLQSLKILKITAKSPDTRTMSFATESLRVISSNNQLESLELMNEHLYSIDINDSTTTRYSENFCSFLNSQSQLKCLILDPLIPIQPNQQSGDYDLNPPFKLEKFIVRSTLESTQQDQFETLRTLFNSCIQTCQFLDFTVEDASHLLLFSEVLNFEKLKELKLYLQCDLTSADVLHACNLWSGRTMKSQLKILEVDGNITNSNYHYYHNRYYNDGEKEQFTSTFLLHFLPKSLESLTLLSSFPCDDKIWKLIGKLKKLKYFCAPNLGKTILRCFKINSLETLETFGSGMSPPIRKADETFWDKFRKRNPNFKSIKY